MSVIKARNQKETLNRSSSLISVDETVPNCLTRALGFLRQHDFPPAEAEFSQAVQAAAQHGDIRGLLLLHKHIAKMWLKVYSVRRALDHLKQVKYVADVLQLPVEKMKACKGIGICYQLVRKYDTALMCFKRLLELAWYHDNIDMELQAYDCIGKQYYYLGMMDKAAYYNQRVWNGLTERKDSGARQLSKHMVETRRKKQHWYPEDALRVALDAESHVSSDISEGELPSPMSSTTNTRSFAFLPHSLEPATHRPSPATTRLPPLHSTRPSPLIDTPYLKNSRAGLRPFIQISHLSLNRSLKNYQCLKDAKKIKIKKYRGEKKL